MKEITSMEEIIGGETIKFIDKLNNNKTLVIKLVKLDEDTINHGQEIRCIGLNIKFMSGDYKDEEYVSLSRDTYEIDSKVRDKLEKKYTPLNVNKEEIVEENKKFKVIKTTSIDHRVFNKNIPTYWIISFFQNGWDKFAISDKIWELTEQEAFLEML